jgi:hypothetical protein
MVYLNTIYKILLTLSKAIVNDMDIEMAGERCEISNLFLKEMIRLWRLQRIFIFFK